MTAVLARTRFTPRAVTRASHFIICGVKTTQISAIHRSVCIHVQVVMHLTSFCVSAEAGAGGEPDKAAKNRAGKQAEPH